VRVFLVQAPDDVGGDADKGTQLRRALDAVLAPVPRRAEHLRDLLQVVDEELLGLLAERFPLAPRAERLGREQLLQFLRKRRLRDAPGADAEQLDLVVQRRILAIVERADDIVRGGKVLVAVELSPRQRDEM